MDTGIYRVAIIKLQVFKGCWRENYWDHSSEIRYLQASEHAQVKYKKKKSTIFTRHMAHIEQYKNKTTLSNG